MHDFTVLVLPGTFASSVAVTLDMLEAAATIAPRVKAPVPTWRVVSPAAGEVALGAGLRVRSARLPQRARADASTWIVSGLGTRDPVAIDERLATDGARCAVAALRRHVARGGSVAASCAAVFLLQAAGVLAGRRATTSWWLASELARREPGCAVDADRMLCVDGPVTTAGAALAQADLMLHLLRQRCGVALADAVARVLLLDGRTAQAPFAVPALMANGDELVRRLTQRIEAALPRPPSVAALAREFAMSTRTLARHVRAATGHGPLALVQAVRLNHARQLIESSRLTIAQVAERVGYEDSTALRRLMRKSAGASPSRFRSAVR